MINYFYKIFLKYYIKTRYEYKNLNIISSKEMFSRMVSHQKKMPDFLGFGIKLVSSIFLILFCIKKFIKPKYSLINAINRTRASNILTLRNLIRFHDSLFEVAHIEEKKIQNKSKIKFTNQTDLFDFIIIGSGPGGAISAKIIQNSNLNSCIIEKGDNWKNKLPDFSYNQMLHQYNYGGITTTLGNANIAYTEGSTFGGGSEINSGLYHRTPENILKSWKKTFSLKSTLSDDLSPHFESIEKKLCVSYFPDGLLPKASLKLKEGSEDLNLEVREIPRWYKYDNDKSLNGMKMTMSRTYLKDYKNDGGMVFHNTKVKKIKKINSIWEIHLDNNEKNEILRSKNVILSAGAIGTPQILLKSNLSEKAGNRIQMHPTIKVVALFDEDINSKDMGVPVHQVKEFGSEYSFGCSISSKTYLKLAMLDHFNDREIVNDNWKKMAIYYVMIRPQGYGKIKNYPFFNDPIIKYHLTNLDKRNLTNGLKLLCKILMKAKAKIVFPCVYNSPIIKTMNDINKLPKVLSMQDSSLMSVHLFSSCPIGEDKKKCVANSYGKVFDHDGLYIADGSMLPTAPGVNPQGSIMALTHRNIQKIITPVS